MVSKHGAAVGIHAARDGVCQKRCERELEQVQ
jgi:hypothetical protein